jgi:hypothetical protein
MLEMQAPTRKMQRVIPRRKTRVPLYHCKFAMPPGTASQTAHSAYYASSSLFPHRDRDRWIDRSFYRRQDAFAAIVPDEKKARGGGTPFNSKRRGRPGPARQAGARVERQRGPSFPPLRSRDLAKERQPAEAGESACLDPAGAARIPVLHSSCAPRLRVSATLAASAVSVAPCTATLVLRVPRARRFCFCVPVPANWRRHAKTGRGMVALGKSMRTVICQHARTHAHKSPGRACCRHPICSRSWSGCASADLPSPLGYSLFYFLRFRTGHHTEI